MVSRTARFLTNAFKGVFGGEVIPRVPDPGASRRSPLRRKPLLEGLEHRLLLSADPVGALGADPAETTEPAVSAPLAEQSDAGTAAPPIITAVPSEKDDSYVVDEDTVLQVDAPGVLVNDGEGPLTAALVSGPERGVLDLRADGTVFYTPVANDSGTVSFTYRAQNADGEEWEATVTISINPVNDAPVASGGDFEVTRDTALSIGFEQLGTDVDGDTLEFAITEEPKNGSLEYTSVGIVYKPNEGFVGSDSFSYTVNDGWITSSAATVTIAVTEAANRAPEFVGAPPAEPFIIDADIGFDSDGVFKVAGPPGQTVTVELLWKLREASYNNEVGIYKVSDSDGRVAGLLPGTAGYAKAALAAGNYHVVFASGMGTGAEASLEGLVGGDLYAFYIIQNGKTETFLSSNPDNKVDGRPLAFFSIAAANPDKFDHAHAAIEAQTGFLNLRWEDLTGGGDVDLNDVMMTVAGLASASDEGVYVYNASENVVDADGDALTYCLVSGPEGAWIDARTGVLSWAAAPSAPGEKFRFVIKADDGKGGSDTQEFDLTVITRTTDLVIQGTAGKDRIEVSQKGGLLTVRLNDVARVYSDVSSLKIEAFGGDDSISLRGLTMRTTADGGDGNDCIDASYVTACGVTIYGGAGNDWLNGSARDDRIDGGAGDDQLTGGSGNDVLVGGQGRDSLYGADGNDLLDGGSENDYLRGGRGNDLIVADAGDDYLKGEDGNDILVGGAGNDCSQGNSGADLIVDGPGRDSNGTVGCDDRVVSGSAYDIPTTLPQQPPGPVIDWGTRYEALVSSLQQFRDHPSNPEWWESFVNNLGQTQADSDPNSQIRVVGPGQGM